MPMQVLCRSLIQQFFLSLSLCSFRFVSLTLSELEFLLSNMKVPYFLPYHVCRITVLILPWINLPNGYSCCSLVLISQVSKSKSLICMCSCINISNCKLMRDYFLGSCHFLCVLSVQKANFVCLILLITFKF